MGDEDRPLAPVFRTSLLPFSETFIRDQVLALRRWRALADSLHIPVQFLAAVPHAKGSQDLNSRGRYDALFVAMSPLLTDDQLACVASAAARDS